jgi:CheY-like chemotaxis protein
MMELKPILLAEDSSKDVELTLEALSENGLANRVVVVKDGVEALDYLRYEGKYKTRSRGMPAVFLLDLKMPRLNGIEVLHSIRNDPKLKTLPVVVLSSSREEIDLIRCYELGANAYVVKPVHFKDFVDAVKNIGVFWGLLNELPSEKEN